LHPTKHISHYGDVSIPASIALVLTTQNSNRKHQQTQNKPALRNVNSIH